MAKKFKTMYKDLPSIEKRLDELVLEDSRRGFTKKEEQEHTQLIFIARKLRKINKPKNLTLIRKEKIEKIKTNMGV